MCEVRATSDLSADERAAIWATLQDNMQDMYVDFTAILVDADIVLS